MAKNASQVVLVVNNPLVSAGDISDPWAGKIPSGRAWQPTPVYLSGEIPMTDEHGGLQSVGSERDTTEQLNTHMQARQR